MRGRAWSVTALGLLLQRHARETKVQKVGLCVSGLHATTSVVSHKNKKEKTEDRFSFVYNPLAQMTHSIYKSLSLQLDLLSMVY